MSARAQLPRGVRLALGVAIVGSLWLTACDQPSSAGPIIPAASDPGGVAPQGGDIPDSQVFLTYQGSGFSLQYPEGWVQTLGSNGIVFQDKDNRISVTVAAGAAPTADVVGNEIQGMAGAQVTNAPHTVSLPAGSSVAATYQVDGAADPVTGKRPHLSVDRYELGRNGQLAVLELAGPVGVDNLDAYRMIAESFRWQ